MSGVLKAVGKVFKSVTKIVKKIALPALAIGAVVLTGGAALGLFGAGGLSGVIGSLGIKGALAGILTTAAKGATFGAVGSLLTGGNPLKGATTGLVLGGVMGGIGALGATPGASTAAQAGRSGIIDNVASAAKSGGMVSTVDQAVAGLDAMQAARGIGSAVSPAVAAITPAAAQAVAAAPTVAQVASSAGGGGLLGFLNQNPIIASGLIQGIGSGLVASSQAKDAQRQRDQIAANYADTSGLFQMPANFTPTGQPAAERYDPAVYGRVKYDPNTGRVVGV